MIELHPAADALDVLGLPAIPYPVALPVFQAAVANDGELPLADMLHGLQLRAAHGADWQRLEPAMARLSELIAGEDARARVEARGEDWQLELGLLDRAKEAVALQRGGCLLAVLASRGDGGLRVTAFRPLDGSALALLLDLARMPDDGEGGFGNTRGAWARARAAALATPQPPADDLTPFLVHLPHGTRFDDASTLAGDGDEALAARRPACVAAELATWDALRHRT